MRLAAMLQRLPNTVVVLVGDADGPARQREEEKLRWVLARAARRPPE
jgi:hypothetical protein